MCYINKGSENEEAEVKTEPTGPPSIALSCRELVSPEDGDPQSEVSLSIGSETTIIDTIYACMPIEAADYPTHEIPSEAVSACGGWFAGAGDYAYALVEGSEVKVFMGWQDEMDPDGGYHYELKKTVAIP